MKVFVSFEDGILNNSFYLENLFVSIRNYGINFKKHINKVILESLSYNPKTIAILKDNYENNIIHVLYHKKNLIYAEKFKSQFEETFKHIKLVEIINNNKLKTIESLCSKFAYISGSILDYQICKKSEESSMVSNIFFNFIHLLISKKSKDSRTTMFDGFFSIFFGHLYLIFPIFAIWPSWMEVGPEIINLSKVKGIFVSSIGFFSFMSLFRTLLSLDKERNEFFNDKEPLCGKEFIKDCTKIRTGVFVLGIFFLFGLYGIFLNIIGGLIGFGFSVVFFVLYLSKFWYRMSRMLLLFFISNIIVNPFFALKLFKITN